MLGSFTVRLTPLDDLLVINSNKKSDSRGSLKRLFSNAELESMLGENKIVQINHTVTSFAGTIRGLHFQLPPSAEIKIVYCIRGSVFDVAVDLRRGSKNFLRWHSEFLSLENGNAMLIPKGFAHGFQTLTDDCELIYLHSAEYDWESESGIRADDPRLNINWPLHISNRSDRDKSHKLIDEKFTGVVL